MWPQDKEQIFRYTEMNASNEIHHFILGIEYFINTLLIKGLFSMGFIGWLLNV